MATTNTTTEITLDDAKNPWAWARENLTEKRREAFYRSLRKLEQEKNTQEYWAASRIADNIADSYYIARYDEVTKIQDEADEECRKIDEQINELYAIKNKIRETASEQITKIRVASYQTQGYKEADAEARAIAQKQNEIYLPKVAALMQKYAERQQEARQLTTEWANR